MNNIEEKANELVIELGKLRRYLKYASDPSVIESIKADIEKKEAQLDIWLSFLS